MNYNEGIKTRKQARDGKISAVLTMSCPVEFLQLLDEHNRNFPSQTLRPSDCLKRGIKWACEMDAFDPDVKAWPKDAQLYMLKLQERMLEIGRKMAGYEEMLRFKKAKGGDNGDN